MEKPVGRVGSDPLVTTDAVKPPAPVRTAKATPTAARDHDTVTAKRSGRALAAVPLGPITPAIDIQTEILASVDTPSDHRPVIPGLALDIEAAPTSWDQFPAFLSRLHAVQLAHGGKHVTLDINVHGNNGTGFKLESDGRGGRQNVSLASAAWINARLREAGFTPADVTIVADACNAGHAYVTTIDGMDAAERHRAHTQAAKLAKEDKQDLGRFEIHDVLADKATPGTHAPTDGAFHWIGRASGTTFAGTGFVQVLTGLGVPGAKRQPAVPTSAALVYLNRLQPGDAPVSGREDGWAISQWPLLVDAWRAAAPQRAEP